MADYIYSSAIRPIAEVGLTMALAMGSGFLGRQFNISNTGFNQYFILVGLSGVGKEGGDDGVQSLISAVRPQIPQVDEFIGPASFASGQAFIRALDKTNNFFSIFGEIGVTLSQLCDKRASSHEIQFKKVLLDLYGKSGHNKYLRPSAYSDKEKNTGLVRAPCVSFWGDTTPEIFYGALDDEHVAQGLIPRLNVTEYKGGRPSRNPNAFHPPAPALVTKLAAAFQVVLAMKFNEQYCNVPLDHHAKKILDEYDLYIDDKINTGGDDAQRQIYNRAHLKALKLCGLVAVGCNLHSPVVTKEIADWAIQFVTRDVDNMVAHFSSGDVGHGDHKCESEIRKAVDKYGLLTEKQRKDFNVPRLLLEKTGTIPFVFLKKFCGMRTAFKNDRRGAVVALNAALADMVKAGILAQVPMEQAKKELGVESPVYYKGESWA